LTLATGTWPGFVARVATPCTPSDLAQMIGDAWPAVVGGGASGGQVLACLAQILLETGTRMDPNRDGETTAEEQAPGFWNGNAGNVRGTYLGAWTSFRAGEGHGAGAVTLEPGPNNRFRSYLSATDDPTDPEVRRAAVELGVRDYLSLLARKYPRALMVAEQRDYRGFVHELHAGGYFTASETAYANAEDRLRHTVENLPQVVAFMEGVS
jgi:hypothetical protein